MSDQIIKDIVAKRVAGGDMFTAYDISKEAQDGGVKIRHLNLKNITHQMYADGDMMSYSKTLVDLGNGLQAFVYHPDSLDPYNYKSKHLDGIAPSPAAAPLLVRIGPSLDNIHGLDAENRLNIPSKLFMQFNIIKHDDIVIAIHDTHIDVSKCTRLTRQLAQGASAWDTAIVTEKGNYRVCERMRNKCRDLVGLDKFKITASSTSIKIEPA